MRAARTSMETPQLDSASKQQRYKTLTPEEPP